MYWWEKWSAKILRIEKQKRIKKLQLSELIFNRLIFQQSFAALCMCCVLFIIIASLFSLVTLNINAIATAIALGLLLIIDIIFFIIILKNSYPYLETITSIMDRYSRKEIEKINSLGGLWVFHKALNQQGARIHIIRPSKNDPISSHKVIQFTLRNYDYFAR